MQNVHAICCKHHVEEPEPASRRSNFDLPKLAFDLSELAALRLKAEILDILKDRQNDSTIFD